MKLTNGTIREEDILVLRVPMENQMITHKVEEISPGNYGVWDRKSLEFVFKTSNLEDAAKQCCLLREMFNSDSQMDVRTMVLYCKQRFGDMYF